MASASNAVVVLPRDPPTLATLEVGKISSAVTVKILRKWYVFPRFGGTKPLSVEMVLADQEGTTIQAHVDRKHVYIHDRNLHEGRVYQLSKFKVISNVGVCRATRHNYMITIEMDSIVRPAARNDSIPDPTFVFTPPQDCFDVACFNRDYLVDISGVLTGHGTEIPFNKQSGPSIRMKIELENRGYQFSVILFAEHVRQIKEFIKTGIKPNTVIIILWCKVDNWNGSNQIQRTMGTSRMLINPDVPEAVALRESLTQAILSPTLTVSQHSNSSGTSDDFLLVDEKHTLAQVAEWIHVNNFVVLATIEGVSTEKAWWYPACAICKSYKKVEEDAGMWYCDKCDKHVPTISKKYYIKLYVGDTTDSLPVVLFNINVRPLINRSADAVYD